MPLDDAIYGQASALSASTMAGEGGGLAVSGVVGACCLLCRFVLRNKVAWMHLPHLTRSPLIAATVLFDISPVCASVLCCPAPVVLKDIVASLQDIGIGIVQYHPEAAPGQFEVVLSPCESHVYRLSLHVAPYCRTGASVSACDTRWHSCCLINSSCRRTLSLLLCCPAALLGSTFLADASNCILVTSAACHLCCSPCPGGCRQAAAGT